MYIPWVTQLRLKLKKNVATALRLEFVTTFFMNEVYIIAIDIRLLPTRLNLSSASDRLLRRVRRAGTR